MTKNLIPLSTDEALAPGALDPEDVGLAPRPAGQPNVGYRWIIVALTFATTAIGMMVWASAFPLLNLWVHDLGISRTQGGLIFGLFYIPGIFVALPGSWLLERYPLRRIFLVCWCLILCGTGVTAVATSFFVLCVGRLLFAVGMNIHIVGAPMMLAGWFEGRKRLGAIMAVYSIGVSIGAFSGLHFVGGLAYRFGWRAPMYLLVALTALGAVAVTAIRQPPTLAAASDQSVRSFRHQVVSLTWPVWFLVVGYFCFNIGSDSFLAFTPDYLVQHGYALDTAATIVGSYAFAALFVKLSSAPFVSARNASYFVSLGCALGLMSTVLLLVGQPALAAICMGAAFGFAMPALYALPAFMLGAQRSGLAYGLFQFIYGFGIVIETLLGYARDWTGGYFVSYMLIDTLFGLGFICIFSIRGFQETALQGQPVVPTSEVSS